MVMGACGSSGSTAQAKALPPDPGAALQQGYLRGSLTPGTPQSPVMAVVGDGFSFGLGEDLKTALPESLGSYLGVRVAVSSASGAGYLQAGEGGAGPYSRLVANLDLPQLKPSVVLLQGCFSDVGSSPAAESAAVTALVQTVRHQAPQAKLVVVGSVNSGRTSMRTQAVLALDHAVLDSARRADPRAVTIDPSTEGWQFPRAADDLHPTTVGYRVLAADFAQALAATGVVPSSQVHIPPSVLLAPRNVPPANTLPPPAPATAPLVVVIGASFAAGVGVNRQPEDAWPAILARLIGYRVKVFADPGAGFVNKGDGALGPFSKLLAQANLATLDPALVIVQGGHNDANVNSATERAAVVSLFASIRREAPRARVGLLGFFAHQLPLSVPADLRVIDQEIVSAARSAVPNLLVSDPLAARVLFPRIGDSLHPTAAGHTYIALRVATSLVRNGVVQPPG